MDIKTEATYETAIQLINDAAESYVVPAHLTPSQAELVAAGIHSLNI